MKQKQKKFDSFNYLLIYLFIYTLKNQRLKITQLEKARFIKVNELKLSQIELLQFFHFMCVAENASKLFCMAYLAHIERFLYYSNLSF